MWDNELNSQVPAGKRAEQLFAPPLGLRPREIVVQTRINEISAAIGRYTAEHKLIPREWFEEYYELWDWLIEKA